MAKSSFVIICLFWLFPCQAQIGTSKLAIRHVGSVYIQPKWIGRSITPVCSRQQACGENPGCPVYTFIGKGDWRLPANWEGELIPPFVAPRCYKIIIKPLGDAPCILPMAQYMQPGSYFYVEPGKRIVVKGGITQK